MKVSEYAICLSSSNTGQSYLYINLNQYMANYSRPMSLLSYVDKNLDKLNHRRLYNNSIIAIIHVLTHGKY